MAPQLVLCISQNMLHGLLRCICDLISTDDMKGSLCQHIHAHEGVVLVALLLVHHEHRHAAR